MIIFPYNKIVNFVMPLIIKIQDKRRRNMFKTAPKDNNNPERLIYTAAQPPKYRKRIILDDSENSNQEIIESTIRPKTTFVTKRLNCSTINTTGRSVNMVHMRSISAVTDELNDQFRTQMNEYLRGKLRKLVEKKQQDIITDRYQIRRSHNLETNFRSTKPLDHYYSIFSQQDKLHIEKGVEEAYLLTAKEKIARLIGMKNEREINFSVLSSKIKAKREGRDEIRSKNRINEFKKSTIEEEQWDKNWKQDISKQNNRYRNRLISKNNRQNSPFFSINQ